MKALSVCATLLLLLCAPLLPAANMLEVYLADVEGARVSLIVTPSGQAILEDTGWRGLFDEKWNIIAPDDRDANRIAEMVKLSKVKQIDYYVISHWDEDHVGNISRAMAKLPVPVLAFVDHGPPTPEDKGAQERYNAYLAVVGKAKRIIVKPGDTLPMKGFDVRVVSSAGKTITDPLPGAGAPNPFCGAASARPSRGENPASVGLVYTFGKFRMIDLADLTAGVEYQLMCPNNLVGTVDLFIVSHHGFNMSNSAALVHALHPLAAIMPNGPKKGGQPGAWQIIHNSPGLQDIWQMHYTLDVGDENNAPEQFIANPQKELDTKSFGAVLGDQGNYIQVSARSDGTFTVTNSRNKLSKTYKPQR
jgi:beta-lactamase superfamily II metal-dependent hydrolase